jgi:hypothetical protein
MGGPQGLSGQVRKISPPPGFDPRTVQPVWWCVYIYIYICKNHWALKKVKVGMQPDSVLKEVPRDILGSKRDEVKGG